MGYKKEDLYKEAIEHAKNPDVYFLEDVVTLMPCARSTFFEKFPADSDEMDNIKALLNNNKVSTKVKLRNKLLRSDKAAEILALYKLIGTQEERQALSQSYTDHTTKGEKLPKDKVSINFK
jgi:hypothetical protein